MIGISDCEAQTVIVSIREDLEGKPLQFYAVMPDGTCRVFRLTKPTATFASGLIKIAECVLKGEES